MKIYLLLIFSSIVLGAKPLARVNGVQYSLMLSDSVNQDSSMSRDTLKMLKGYLFFSSDSVACIKNTKYMRLPKFIRFDLQKLKMSDTTSFYLKTVKSTSQPEKKSISRWKNEK